MRRLLILPPLALGVAVLVWQVRSGSEPEQAALEEVTRKVRVIEAAAVEFVPRAIGHGTAQPGRVWEAVAQVSGKIVAKHPDLERGRLLAADTVILTIDPADYRLAIARSEAELERIRAQLAELEVSTTNTRASLDIEQRTVTIAEEDLARKRVLLERGNTSQTSVDLAETALLGARQRVQELENQLRVLPAERRVLEASVAVYETTVEAARLDLERTIIRMPFDGRVAQVDLEATEYVGAGQVLAVIDGIDLAEVTAQLPLGDLLPLISTELDVASLTIEELASVPGQFGLSASVHLRTDRVNATWPARFDRPSDRIDPQTRTIGVIVAVDEPYRQAIPGQRPPLTKDMFVQVELRGRARPETLVVPRVAVHRREDGGHALYLVDDASRLEIRPVELGPAQDDLAVVDDGLQAGELVVVSDLIPAVAGMRLAPEPDAALAGRLRAGARAEAPAPSP